MNANSEPKLIILYTHLQKRAEKLGHEVTIDRNANNQLKYHVLLSGTSDNYRTFDFLMEVKAYILGLEDSKNESNN